MEARRILEEIEGRIKEHYVLREIYKRDNGDYVDLKEKYGVEIILNGIDLVKMYNILCEITKE